MSLDTMSLGAAPHRPSRTELVGRRYEAGLTLGEFRAAVEEELGNSCAALSGDVSLLDPRLGLLADAVTELTLSGGKRLRAALVLAGHQLVGDPDRRAAVRCAAAMEMLHSFALLHDDVIDRSASRRGRATAQISLSDQSSATTGPAAAWCGISGAILAGDLALAWSDAMLDNAGLDPAAWARVRGVLTRLRIEAIGGEFLDTRGTLATAASPTAEEVLRIGLLKSGRYTITRPLQIGVATGRNPAELPALQGFGDAVGVAFQLRDDLLDVYGSELGKPVGSDAGRGSVNAVLVRTAELAGPRDRRLLADLHRAEGRSVGELVERSGARAWAEEVIDASVREAARNLAELPADERTRELLSCLARQAAYRIG